MIYFIQDQGTLNIKIGFTNSHPEARRKGLQTGNSSALVLIAAVPGDKDTESKLHGRFAASRDRGEWFKPTPEVISFLLEANVMGKGNLAQALEFCLVSPNECDRNGEAANVVDGLYAIARGLADVANVIGGNKPALQESEESVERTRRMVEEWRSRRNDSGDTNVR